VAVFVSYTFFPSETIPAANTRQIEGVLDPEPEEPDVSPDSQELAFQKVLEVRNRAVASDGGDLKSVACSKDRNKALVFAFLNIDAKNRARLACADDYLRGISLHYTDKKGEAKNINLGMVDGDAGDSWDSRSWIQRDAQGGLRIFHVSLASVEDVDTEKPLECTVTKTLYSWDAENQIFAETETDEDFDLGLFTPPIGVAPECLDEKGYWKGVNK
jgi:hypothetical protein